MTLQQRTTLVGMANNDSDSDESILGALMAWGFLVSVGRRGVFMSAESSIIILWSFRYLFLVGSAVV